MLRYKDFTLKIGDCVMMQEDHDRDENFAA